MSPIGPENFYRLEEFPSFISCIKCFGRPIIPPLLTASRRHELKQLRIAAINKEAEKLRIKSELLNCQKQDIDIPPVTNKNDYRSSFQSTVQESCALWYPSMKDNEGISVAISKFPTSGIYSSVHTGAIVCSNVIENSHAYTTAIMRGSLLDSGTNVSDCIECSHNSINLECNLCQAEYNQSFHNKSFASEISPEVPCRTFSLLHQNVGVANEELNYAVEEPECESLPTVIYNHKYVPPDTDSESNITSMTQSTDLEKYMEYSCEFNSPDNSAVVWDSKSVSQQYTLSRSDDASSETIVNTENELTPCASTMAELTDTIEDELSNIDETAAVSDKEVVSGTLKRAHSVDSYMKIIQTCAKSMNVKKSLSEPFNTDLKSVSGSEETRIPLSLKTSLLIKEDSKESEESKDMPEREESKDRPEKEKSNDIAQKEESEYVPEKDISDQVSNKEIFTKDFETESNDNTFQKKHIRQNSYTLDEPSSALILAHADCTCNFDANCISPHCSALKDEKETTLNSAFTKEKVELDIPVSHQQMKKLPILGSLNSFKNEILNKDGMTSTVMDVFPVVKEDDCEKSDSGNAPLSETVSQSETQTVTEINRDTGIDDKEPNMVSQSFNLESDKSKKFFEHVYQELQESHRMRVKELFEEQNRLFLRLQEEFKEQERFLREKLKLPISGSPPKIEETEQNKINDCCSNGKIVDEKELSISNISILSPDQSPTSDISLIKNSALPVSSASYQPTYSPSKNLSFPQNARASVSPSREFETSNSNPSKPLENVKNKQLFKDSDRSITYSGKNNADNNYLCCSESMRTVNGFSCTTTPVLLPQCNSPPQSPKAVAVPFSKKCDIYRCDNSLKQCKCCTSFNDYCEYDVNNSHSKDVHSEQQNSVSDTKILNNNINFLQSHTSSSSIQGKNLNPDFSNYYNAKSPKKNVSSSSKTSNNYISDIKNVMPLASNDVESSSAVNKDGKALPQSLKEKSKLSVVSTVSLGTKTVKNGSLSQAAVNKKIIDDPVLLKKFEKLPAFVKGYLTRRLFKAERVQSLIKTLQDTANLIGKLSEDLSLKGDSVSDRDVDFHRQLIVQLMTTFHNVYDIFCTVSTKERMAIIAESRNLRLKQKVLDQKPEPSPPVTTKASEPAPSKKNKLSSATLKVLEKRRSPTIDSRTYTRKDFKNARSRSTLGMRTYTIDNLENFQRRTHSSMSSKNLSVSPSSIYKTSVGVRTKKKTASAKTPGSHQYLHQKWVP